MKALILSGGSVKGAYQAGGIRDVLPIGTEMEDPKVDEIVIVSVHPQKLSNTNNIPNASYPFNIFMPYADRVMDIIVSECVNNDLRIALLMNAIDISIDYALKGLITAKSNRTKRKVKIHLVQPQAQLMIDLNDFETSDIKKLIEQGENDARKVVFKSSYLPEDYLSLI